jgi:formylmethanofuran dehydrogenase subunit E
VETLTIDPATADLDALIESGVRLHGHLGPFLVAGIRMGLLALRELDSPGYFGLRAESRAGQVTPLSCLNDGIQIGSGCTAGKGNLMIVGEGEPSVRFRSDEGRTIEVRLRSEIVRSFADADTVQKAREIRSAPEEALFAWSMSPS